MVSGEQPVEEGRPGSSDVQVACGGGSESDANIGSHKTHQKCKPRAPRASKNAKGLEFRVLSNLDPAFLRFNLLERLLDCILLFAYPGHVPESTSY